MRGTTWVVSLISLVAHFSLYGSGRAPQVIQAEGAGQIKGKLTGPDGRTVEGVLGIAELAGGTLVNMGHYTVSASFSWNADISCDKRQWEVLQARYSDGRAIGSDTHLNIIRRIDDKTIELGPGTRFQTISLLRTFLPLVGAPGSSVTLPAGASVVFEGMELSPAGPDPVTFRIAAKDRECVVGGIKGGKLEFRQRQADGQMVSGFLSEAVAAEVPTPAARPSSAELLEAAETGAASKLKALVARGADVNAKNDSGITGLMLAALEGHTAAAQVLLELGADPAARNRVGVTPLMLAARQGQTAVVNVLLARGVDINARSDFGFTALILAADSGQSESVRALLGRGAEVNAKSKLGLTALMGAARNGHAGIAEMLLAKGAQVNAKNQMGETALSMAAEKGRTAIVELLRKAGATR